MAVGIISVLCVTVCISHISSVVSFDQLSDLQIATHPKYLYTCGDKGLSLGKVSKQQEEQNIISLIDCLGNGGIKKIAPTMKQEKVNQFNEVLRQMKTGHWRLKRQVSNEAQPRREVRMLSPAEWQILITRFNGLRESGFYRTILEFFSDESIAGTNGGPAFLGWHRVILLWLEFYLHVPLPYWDCSLDFHITDPTKSILWTKEFFGNGEGAVRVGPFMNFTDPDGSPIRRRIGQGGSLIARENIDSLLSRKSNRELVYTTNIALEEYHNGVQAWVGGTMGELLTAPSDPIYFFHQCFIDKLWEDIRQNMQDSESYPYDPTITDALQNPEKILVKFPFDSRYPLVNSDAYTKHVSVRAHYETSPAKATQPWQCNNPTWKHRRVLAWDTDRQYCVTAQGTEQDFHVIPDFQTSAKIVASTLNSPMNFPIGSPLNSPLPKTPKIKYVAPLKDMRTIYRASEAIKRKKEAPKMITTLLGALSRQLKPNEALKNSAMASDPFAIPQQSTLKINNNAGQTTPMLDNQALPFGLTSRVKSLQSPLHQQRFHSPIYTSLASSAAPQSTSELSSLVFKLFESPTSVQRQTPIINSQAYKTFIPTKHVSKKQVTKTIGVLESLLARLRTIPH